VVVATEAAEALAAEAARTLLQQQLQPGKLMLRLQRTTQPYPCSSSFNPRANSTTRVRPQLHQPLSRAKIPLAAHDAL